MIFVLDFVGVLYNPHVQGETGGLFDDVIPFLKGHKADKLFLLSTSAKEVLEPKLEEFGIRQYLDTVICTAGGSKGDALAGHSALSGENVIVIDGNPRHLDMVAEAMSEVTCVHMERFPDDGSLTISEFQTVSNLAELEALVDALEEDF